MIGALLLRSFTSVLVVILFWFGPIGSMPAVAVGDPDDANQAAHIKKIYAVGYVTWWSHDAIGYHPAIILRLENTSGVDLSKAMIHLQGRFTDLRNGYVTVARKDMRADFAFHQRATVSLRGPSSFELPIDENAWPTIECKTMCRVGDVGDEGTQDLVITRLEPITMTDEEALSQLTKQTGLGWGPNTSPPNKKWVQEPINNGKDEQSTANVKSALSAVAISLTGEAKKNQHKQKAKSKNCVLLNMPAHLPLLGDDFYLFEKCFGIPAASDIVASKDDLTWVSYPAKGSFTHIFVGSKAASGKADLIVVVAPAKLFGQEKAVMALAQLLTSKPRHQNFTAASHCVRYLPEGRTEMIKFAGQDCRVISFTIVQSGTGQRQTVLAASRLPTDLESCLALYAKRLPMLQVLLPTL